MLAPFFSYIKFKSLVAQQCAFVHIRYRNGFNHHFPGSLLFCNNASDISCIILSHSVISFALWRSRRFIVNALNYCVVINTKLLWMLRQWRPMIYCNRNISVGIEWRKASNFPIITLFSSTFWYLLGLGPPKPML